MPLRQRRIEGFGWKPQIPDIRDRRYAVTIPLDGLPRYVNLSDKMPPVWNQGRLGSCTAHGTGAAISYDLPGFMPSRLMLYWDGRYIEGSTESDAGAMIRDVVKAAAQQGVADEADWPYEIDKFRERPPQKAYDDGAKHRVISYESVPQDLNYLKAAITAGHPVVFGFTVYDSFEGEQNARTGMMPIPDFLRENVIGGHCVVAVGYNSRNYFMCRNSWGRHWGDPDFPGHFWMPPSFITNPDFASDFWIIKSVEK